MGAFAKVATALQRAPPAPLCTKGAAILLARRLSVRPRNPALGGLPFYWGRQDVYNKQVVTSGNCRWRHMLGAVAKWENGRRHEWGGGDQYLTHRIRRPPGEATSGHSGHMNMRWEPGLATSEGGMGPRRGTRKEVTGDAGGSEIARGTSRHSAVRALSWLPFYR